jgi:hypothetical protein
MGLHWDLLASCVGAVAGERSGLVEKIGAIVRSDPMSKPGTETGATQSGEADLKDMAIKHVIHKDKDRLGAFGRDGRLKGKPGFQIAKAMACDCIGSIQELPFVSFRAEYTYTQQGCGRCSSAAPFALGSDRVRPA